MPRALRSMPADLAYHVLNRTSGQVPIFADPEAARRFVIALTQALERVPTGRLLAWCLMPNHWHLVFHPCADDVVQPLVQWLSLTHARRHRKASGSVGHGHLYQGRYKSFPIATDGHLLTVLRYVERNPVRTGMVGRAGDWPWSSATRCVPAGCKWWPKPAAWPVACPVGWADFVDRPQTAAEEKVALDRLRSAARHGRPFGPAAWTTETARRLGLRVERSPADAAAGRAVEEGRTYPSAARQ